MLSLGDAQGIKSMHSCRSYIPWFPLRRRVWEGREPHRPKTAVIADYDWLWVIFHVNCFPVSNGQTPNKNRNSNACWMFGDAARVVLGWFRVRSSSIKSDQAVVAALKKAPAHLQTDTLEAALWFSFDETVDTCILLPVDPMKPAYDTFSF